MIYLFRNLHIMRLRDLTKEEIKQFYLGYLPKINFCYLNSFEESYPDFSIWIKTKVINNRDKEVIFLSNENILLGFSILKFSEKKICSFYLVPYFRHKNNSSFLIEYCFKLLNCRFPLITVSEVQKDNFINLFSKYNFNLFYELDNLYRENSIEYVFNREFIK